MNLFNDFKLKIIIKFDLTFWLHMAREFVIFQIIFWITQAVIGWIYIISDMSVIIGIVAGIAFAFGVNFAWEYQDGNLAELKYMMQIISKYVDKETVLKIEKALIQGHDGFNVLDFLAGCSGILLSIGFTELIFMFLLNR